MKLFTCMIAAFASLNMLSHAYEGDCCNDLNNYEFDVKASYLYWSAEADNLTYGIERSPYVDEENPPVAMGTIKNHHPKFDSGVRVEGGFRSQCSSFGANLQWTGYQSKSNASANSGDSELPLINVTTFALSNYNGSPFLTSQDAKSTWKLNINEYAFDIYYSISCCSCATLRPYVGIYGATIRQKQNIAYGGVVIGEDTANIGISRKNDFCGLGPRLGLAFQWEFCNNFSLISNANAAFLVGRFKLKNKMDVPEELSQYFVDIEEKVRRARPMASGLIGLEWSDSINDCFGVSLAISYEYQYWWNQWRSASNALDTYITGEGQWSDLSLHGLVVTGGITF